MDGVSSGEGIITKNDTSKTRIYLPLLVFFLAIVNLVALQNFSVGKIKATY